MLAKYKKIEKPVGQGTYGIVYKGKCIKTGTQVALKKIRLDVEDEGIPSTALREISTLQELRHPNIVRLLDVAHQDVPSRLYLVFEWLDQDLKKHMDKSRKPLTRNLVKSYMWQLLLGIDHCHTRAIIHRDLKPQNLLIDQHGTLKLADFGLARAFCIPIRTYTHEVVTLWYRAPEILLGANLYGLPVDMWSVGTIFAEMATKKPCWPGDSEIDQLMKIFQSVGTPREDNWPGCSKLPNHQSIFPNWPSRVATESLATKLNDRGERLLDRLLTLDPSKRYTARDALMDEYFEDIPAQSAYLSD